MKPLFLVTRMKFSVWFPAIQNRWRLHFATAYRWRPFRGIMRCLRMKLRRWSLSWLRSTGKGCWRSIPSLM